MSWTDKFADWLYLNNSSDVDESIATAREVAAGQRDILARQAAEGNVGLLEYYQLGGQIDAAGNYAANYKDDRDDLVRVIPWWVWIAGLAVVLWYLNSTGILSRILRKGS